MTERRKLYALLIISFMIQSFFIKISAWLPDLMLLMVIFVSVFKGLREGLMIALVTGLLRGFFSVDLLPLDIIVFPVLSFFSAVTSRMFYQQVPVLHMLMTGVSVLFLIISHTIYLNFISGNDLSVFVAISNSWRTVIISTIFAPLFFMSISAMLRKGGAA